MTRAIEGYVVDVVSGEIFPGRVVHRKGVIAAVERLPGPCRGFLVPGFIDCHVHIDSSLLCPSRFAEAAVPHGTTAVVSDPHEIANVLGVPGISWMRNDAAGVPMRTYFTAPSCVPATLHETSGAALGPAEVAELLASDDVVALGEVMDYPAAIAREPGLMAKIGAARRAGKPIDGHCPLLTGEPLRRYVELGISTDHECTGAEEAAEKHALGMRILVREGSAAKNLADLAPFARSHDFCLVTDDILGPDLLAGHMDARLRSAVALGIDPIHALRAVTLRPAAAYRLPIGVLEPGRMADIVRLGDLSDFNVEEVYVGGIIAASGGTARFSARPASPAGGTRIGPRRAEDFRVRASGSRARVRVIRLIPDQIVTEEKIVELPVRAGQVQPDPSRDILAVAVVNRYRDAPVAVGFVSGFGLSAGAIASSVAHDSHNIVAAGTDSESLAAAVNAVIRESGGLALSAGGRTEVLPLPCGGLMSAEPPPVLARRLDALHRLAAGLGCALPRPFMTLSFLTLLVIPRLKVGDRGLFDAHAQRFVDPVVAG